MSTPAGYGQHAYSPGAAAPVADAGPRGGPAREAASVPAAPAAPAVPAPGTLATARIHDAYAQPARERELVILVTSADTDADSGDVTAIRGFQLGFADEAGAFKPDSLTWE